jgi:predicted ATP-dependent endonuclease of OLD family
MNYIESVEIENFWGDKSVNLIFNESENFLIGVNGSGKTTIINLIAATLTADFQTLDRVEFEKVSIFFKNKHDKRRRPKIEVTKISDKNSL